MTKTTIESVLPRTYKNIDYCKSSNLSCILSVVTFLFSAVLFAQETDILRRSLTLSAYVDGYLSTYSNELPQTDFQPYETVGARDNTFGVNIVQLGVGYEGQHVRGNIILHYGDIPQATWSSEFNEVQEANVGVRLSDGLWLNAGFFSTHVGTESFLPKNNRLSNTAFKTFNEPFFQAGARLSYSALEKWDFELWALNGYNQFVDTNDAKSVGALVKYRFRESTSITYTNLFGRESPDGAPQEQIRFYQNIYLNQNWHDTWLLTVGLDYGLQTHSDLDDPDSTATLYAALVTLRYQFTQKYSVTTRAEVFNDPSGFISGTVQNTRGVQDGVTLYGLSLGTEYRPSSTSYLRAEGRFTHAEEDLQIFVQDGRPTHQRWEFLLTMGLEVSKVIDIITSPPSS